MPLRMLDSAAGRLGSLRLLRLLLAASVAVPVLLFGVIAWREYLASMEEAQRSIRKTTLIVHEHVLKVFDTLAQTLDRVDERTRGMGWEEIDTSPGLHLYLKTLKEELDQIGAIGLVAPDGRVSSSSIAFPLASFSIAERKYFQAMKLRDTGLTISEPIRSAATGRRTFSLSQRRTSTGGPDGRFDGMIVATIDPDYFHRFYERFLIGGNETISLVRSDGQMVLRHPLIDGNIVLSPTSGFIRSIPVNAEEGQYRTVGETDGVDRLYGYKKIGRFPLYVVYAVAVSDVVGTWLADMALYAAFAIPATLALALIAWTAFARSRSEAAAVQRWAQEVRNRETLESALRQSQKLEALGQLTGGVAHDFNNLLTAALANLQLLERHLPAEGRRFLDGTVTALGRAEKLTRQLLSFSRQEAVNPTVVDLGSSVFAMSDLLERSIRADIELRWDVGDQPLTVEVDPVQLELAVLNLVLNARDAMPQGGVIHIAIRPGPEALTVELTVADNGPGMPPEVQARAFEPFFTTKGVGKGTGLGLSMVYGFARQSGGSAQIDSAPGMGTTVTLTLPVTAKPLAPPQPADESPAPHPSGIRVLLVEDNALVLMATVEGLTQEGFSVETADHGAAALELLECDSAFDILVSDVVMPYGVSGIDLARRVRERWPQIRILLASGYSPDSLATMGADTAAVLPKPFTPDQLAARIRTLLLQTAA